MTPFGRCSWFSFEPYIINMISVTWPRSTYLVLMGVAGLWDVSMFRMSGCASHFFIDLDPSTGRDNALSNRPGNQRRISSQSRWTSRVPSRNWCKYLVFSCRIRERRRKSSPSYSFLSMCNPDADNFSAYIHLRRSEETRYKERKENQQNKQ